MSISQNSIRDCYDIKKIHLQSKRCVYFKYFLKTALNFSLPFLLIVSLHGKLL